MRQFFRSFAQRSAEIVGSPGSFLVGLIAILVWVASGPYYDYSDTWQLVINTGSSIVTFLMVFLIQSTQNRDAKVMHLKLDELIRAVTPARNHLVHLENLSDEEKEAGEKGCQMLHEERNTSASERPTRPRSLRPSQS